jgi:L-ascorbate metabolism protein UlaG (beta-lactamase superfamily)
VITAFQKDDAFLADVALPSAKPEELKLWWLGQSGFLVRFDGRFLLLDPYLSDSLTHKYAATDKPHVRMTERVIAPERLANISVVTSSHTHTDHLDAATLRPLLVANPQMRFVIPEANRAFVAERLDIDASVPVGLDDGASTSVAGFEFQGIAAAHSAIDRDTTGRCHYLGFVVRCGPWTLYHSGDTLAYPGLAEKLRPFQIDVALLPINGDRPERRVAGNLDGREAAQLAHAAAARWVIPCHYDMFAFNTADPAELFVPECTRLSQRHRVLRAGEGWAVPER